MTPSGFHEGEHAAAVGQDRPDERPPLQEGPRPGTGDGDTDKGGELGGRRDGGDRRLLPESLEVNDLILLTWP